MSGALGGGLESPASRMNNLGLESSPRAPPVTPAQLRNDLGSGLSPMGPLVTPRSMLQFPAPSPFARPDRVALSHYSDTGLRARLEASEQERNDLLIELQSRGRPEKFVPNMVVNISRDSTLRLPDCMHQCDRKMMFNAAANTCTICGYQTKSKDEHNNT